ncbi:hypothetical protein [Pseudomonas sp. microsymbiont 2]
MASQEEIKKADELMKMAVKAVRLYHEAKGIKSADELRKLKAEVEHLLMSAEHFKRLHCTICANDDYTDAR